MESEERKAESAKRAMERLLPIALDTQYLEPDVTEEMIAARREHVALVLKQLRDGTCRGGEMTGWLRPDEILEPKELARLKDTAQRLWNETDVLLVIGIGGSYLGARAVIEALADDGDRVVYAGQNLSAHYLARLRKQLDGKRVAINVISKSGETVEPAVAFRIMRDLAGDHSPSRIVATTDPEKGTLRQIALDQRYEIFEVPRNIGGRYSVLSAVGLLPIAYAGVDIDALIAGAAECARFRDTIDPLVNPAYFYACARNILYHQGFAIELLAAFEPRLHYFGEWWKQLFGESEGKEHMALFAASVDYTTDLHSLGQYVQQGRRIMFETFLTVGAGEPPLKVPDWPGDPDKLGYLAGKQVRWVNDMAHRSTALAHHEGGVPNLTICLRKLDACCLGALIYFFEAACAASALMLGVNPFNQPGVEAYKQHMFRLLGKP